MNINHFLLVLCSLFTLQMNAQIGIGTKTPHPSAALDLTSTSKGLLIPKMTTTQRDAIQAPTEGLEVFSTTDQTKFYFDGVKWEESFSRKYNAYYQIYEFASPGGTGRSSNQINLAPISVKFSSEDANYAEVNSTNAIKILQNGEYFIEITGELVRAGTNPNPVTGRYVIKKKVGTGTSEIATCYESLGQVYQNVYNSNSIGATFPPIALVNGDILTVWAQNVDGTLIGTNLLFQQTTLSLTKKIN